MREAVGHEEEPPGWSGVGVGGLPADGEALVATAAGARLPGLAWLAAGATLVVLAAFATRYGWHRDELYFLQCGRRLAGGYVDQPIMVPLIARLSVELFGRSLFALRLFPALASAATVVLCAGLAREFGGGRTAQTLGAVGAATAPAVLGAGHLFGPTAFDLTAWTALAVVVARLGRTRDPRLWVPAGVITAIGLANKHSIAFFALAILIGLVASGEGRLLLSPWFVVGAVITVAFVVPDLVWQAGHHWATIPMTRRLNQKYGGPVGLLLFVPSQLVMASPALVGMWLAGLAVLWRSVVRPWRAFAIAYAVLFPFFGLTGGKHPYYLAGMYIVLLAAGAVVAERRAAAGAIRIRSLMTGLIIATLVALPIVLPILPPRAIAWTSPIDPVQVETVGWPEFVRSVAAVWSTLPAEQRSHAVIFTASYGEAGAINELGHPYRLPQAVSGQNNFWWWGPGNPQATTVVAVGPGPTHAPNYVAYLRRFFRDVVTVATITNHDRVANQEQGGHVYLCHDPIRPWGQLWPQLQHYD